MERLRNKFLSVSLDTVLHPASFSAQQAATEQKGKAARALADEHRKGEDGQLRNAAQAKAAHQAREQEERPPKPTAVAVTSPPHTPAVPPISPTADTARAISDFVGRDPVAGEAALGVLAGVGPNVLNDILRQTSVSYQQTIRLKKLCAQFGPAAIPQLLDAIQNGDWQLKCRAAPCFSAFRGNNVAANGLYQLLKVRDFDVQRLAIAAIGHLGDDNPRWAIVRLAKYDNLDRDPSDITPVYRYSLGKLHTYVLEALMRFFGKTGDVEILKEIEQFAEVCSEQGYGSHISGSIRQAREDLTPVAADGLVNTWLPHEAQQFREYAIDCLAHLRLRRTMSSLVGVLRNSREVGELRQSAAIALGAVDNIHAARCLAKLLEENPQCEYVDWAFSTLYRQPIRWPGSSRYIDSALSSTGEVRQQMLVSLGWRRATTFQTVIEEGLHGTDPFNRGTCALALAHLLGHDAIDALAHSGDEAASEIERVFAVTAQIHAGMAARGDALHKALEEVHLPMLRPFWQREVLSAMFFADGNASRAQLWAEIANEDLDATISEVRALRLGAEQRPPVVAQAPETD
jgi:hypothetical protein